MQSCTSRSQENNIIGWGTASFLCTRGTEIRVYYSSSRKEGEKDMMMAVNLGIPAVLRYY
jgi:hypothetical protein